MINLKSIVAELIVSDLTSKNSDKTKYFVAYKDKLFLLDDDTNLARVKLYFKDHPSIKYHKHSAMDEDKVYDFVQRLAETAPDIVAGEYHPDIDNITVYSSTDINPMSSLTIKKIAKQLGVKNVSRDYFDAPSQGDEYITYPTKKLIGDVPKVVFHGTNSDSLQRILIYGLDPGRGSSKWGSIIHQEHIFFAATFRVATYYAMNAVRVTKNKYDTFPIVLEIIIPDISFLAPDYDADRTTTQQQYYTWSDPDAYVKTTMPSMGVSREIGKWGYKGRIPAQFIHWVYYYVVNEKKWKKSRPETWRKLLERYDWENIGYRLGLFLDLEKEKY